MPRFDIPLSGWAISAAPVGYQEAVAAMELRADAIRQGRAANLVWLLEHPPLYTAGTSADHNDLIDPRRLPVHETGRGGQYTYHGPGQRIAYVMLDLTHMGRDVRGYVNALQEWIIAALAELSVTGECRAGRPGVWVRRRDGLGEDKIAAVGVRVRRWVSFHGVSMNVDPDLEHYSGIVPCGLREHGVTSLHALGVTVAMAEFDGALRRTFEARFSPTTNERAPLSSVRND
ncbi:MAG: lipoyl(octanoyl) transferase LipB [Chitinophagales bacterium]|nr:lipoyl(octanoyl) transferase LipB [Hyphomicrobiales bacterium]